MTTITIPNLPSVEANLLTSSVKTAKGEKRGVETGVLYLSPYTLATDREYLCSLRDALQAKIDTGHPVKRTPTFCRIVRELTCYIEAADGVANVKISVCPGSTRGCRRLCLGTTSGHFRLSMNVTAQVAQVRRTRFMLRDPAGFQRALQREIDNLRKRAQRKGYVAAARLNGTSDLRWEDTWLIRSNPDVVFYDYTKLPPASRKGFRPANYHLVYSVSESAKSWRIAAEYLDNGGTAAVVFDRATYREVLAHGTYNGYPVLDGDETDVRFEDPAGHVVALKAKGDVACSDRSGFVKRDAGRPSLRVVNG